jgi:hypothetical protein
VAITRDQKSTVAITGSATTLGTTFATKPAAGTKMLVFIQYEASQVMTVTDNAGNTYTQDASQATGGKKVWIYRADNIAVPAGAMTVTLSVPGVAETFGIVAASYAGVATGGPSIAAVKASGTGTAASSGAVNPGSNYLYFGGMSNAAGGNPSTVTLGATGVDVGVNKNGSLAWPWEAVDLIGSGSQTFTWTITSSAWCTCFVTYATGTAAAAVRMDNTSNYHRRARDRAASY